ncbi:uncharacterized protein METZ01_LOCUS240405, partial [marine metagenome]
MNDIIVEIPSLVNEKVKNYEPGSEDRSNLNAKLTEMENKLYDIPVIIGGEEIYTGNKGQCRMPHRHQHILAEYHKAGTDEIYNAIDTAIDAWYSWSNTPIRERAAIFRRAAELLAGSWRNTINAATMLNQSKNVYQAEIDSACELIDFFNFNSQFAEDICSNQPLISPDGMKNNLEYRALE